MSHVLVSTNKELPTFRLSNWPHLLAQCGAYFTCVSRGARWYALLDERMITHYHDVNDNGEPEQVTDKNYPAIICQCGFEVTEEEAKVMARIARNYTALQRTLEEPSEEERTSSIMTPEHLRPFPQKIRQDWVENYENFAEWAEQSHGFKIF